MPTFFFTKLHTQEKSYMREYVQLLMEIFGVTMSKGQYRTALQALQAIIKFQSATNKQNGLRLEDMDDESLMRLIEGYTKGD